MKELLTGECPNCGADIAEADLEKPCWDCGQPAPSAMSEHTATPWRANGDSIVGSGRSPVFGGMPVCARAEYLPEHAQPTTPELDAVWEANAEFIVRAVNAHDALVEVAEQMAELECVGPEDVCNHCLAITALKLAEKE